MNTDEPANNRGILWRTRFACAVALLAWGSVCATDSLSFKESFKLERHAKPARIPELQLVDANGKSLRVSELLGKPIVLNIWATWCGPCVRELPSLDELQRILQADGILVAVVSEDRAPQKVVPEFLQKLKIRSLSSYYDPDGGAVRLLRTPVLPTTLIIDSEGQEVARVVGALEWSDKENVESIRRLVRKRSSS